MAWAEIEGRRIYYEIHGQGEPVLLLHHGFGCSRMWSTIQDGLLEAGYLVILYDRRGYGRSDPGDDFAGFYLSDDFRSANVQDLAVLMGRLGISGFHMVGQCEGGVIASDYAVRYPVHVQSMVAASTQCYSSEPMPDWNRIKFPKSFREMPPALQAKLIEWHGPERAEGLFELCRTNGGAYGTGVFDLREVLQRVPCPALVLYPDRSALFEVEQAVAFYRSLPRGELAVMPYCGHNTYEYRPEEYLSQVLGFLDRVRSGKHRQPSQALAATCLAS